jgi:hypothetical protein
MSKISSFNDVARRCGIFHANVFMVQVKVTKNQPISNEEAFVRTLETGDFFGERALET